MPNEYGVVKVSLSKEIEGASPPIRDVDGALRLLRRFGAALTGDRSNSADWPRITKCIQRGTTIAFDAQASEFEASISFDTGEEGRTQTYLLKRGTPQQAETGWVKYVEALSDSAMRESGWIDSPACALAAYPHRFVVFTSADDHARTPRVWLVGISEFSTAHEATIQD